MPELRKSLGFKFIKETNLYRDDIEFRVRPEIAPTSLYKTYPKAPKLPLPRRWDGKEANLWKILQTRRSKRNYNSKAISKTELTLLLWASQGITAQAGPLYLRTAPSAGALYPIETYCVVLSVEDIEPGIYHFDIKGFQLEELFKGDFRRAISRVALDQSFCARASVVFLWTAIFRRTMCKYADRGVRYIFMDVGHICQNLLLAVTALGLGGCPVGAFFDDEVNYLLGLNPDEESIVYMAAVGHVEEF